MQSLLLHREVSKYNFIELKINQNAETTLGNINVPPPQFLYNVSGFFPETKKVCVLLHFNVILLQIKCLFCKIVFSFIRGFNLIH